ncbi:MAPEG family protein [Novosphingobium sp.]|uniref:MAPEG family protein n=1 Tax=Novosphingobium sp. TaxID=1874826 RepID=UPI00333FFE48
MTLYLPISLAAAAAAALVNIWLSVRIGAVRQAKKISIGDGGDEALIRRMRAQANFIENAPIVLVLIALVEAARPGNPVLAGVAVAFILGRIAHGLGMDGGAFGTGRMVGTLTTMLTLLGVGIWAAIIAFTR